ncbi:cytochrome c oxidase subunit II [soil metagenome]
MPFWSAVGLVVAGCGDQEPGAFAPRGSVAQQIGGLTLVLVVLGAAVFVLVVVALGLAVRSAPSESGSDFQAARSRRLVIGGGVVLPVIVLVPLTVAMLVTGSHLTHREGEVGLTIEVVGHQFWWEVRYPDHGVVTANEIYLPVDTPIRLLLTSADVIHSVWVPQLAGKIDMIPGKTNELRFDADSPGVFRGFCAEFCGLQHGRMHFLVIAQSHEDFETWVTEQAIPAADPPDEAGAEGLALFVEYGCAACHTIRGTEADGVTGPDLTHLASRRTLGAGTVPNRRGNLAGWVVDPQGIKPGNLMPPTPLDGEELNRLLQYLESLR